ncbi:MAG: hypothetical protein R3F59_00140 [Myxococcota bacterium]
MPTLLLALAGCGDLFEQLTSPLLLDGIAVRELTYDRMDADLQFLVDEEHDPEAVDDLDYAMEVDGEAVSEGTSDDTEIDGDVILAPVSVQLGALPSWADLVGRDDVIPFTVTGAYTYDAPSVHLDLVIEQAGEMPAPPAPELDALRLDPDGLSLGVTNRDPSPVVVRLGAARVRIAGKDRAVGPAAELAVPAGGADALTIPLEALDPAWGDAVDVVLEADAVVETDFGPIPYPVSRTFAQVSIRP